MKDKKIIILIILGVAAVISLFSGIVTPGKIRRNIINQPAVISQELAGIIGEKPALLTRNAKKTTYLSWYRDPFSSSFALIKEYGYPTLSGIIWDKENPMAIINNNIERIGDKVCQNTVIDIKSDKVILNDGKEDFELKLKQ